MLEKDVSNISESENLAEYSMQDGIIICTFKKGCVMDLDTAKKMVKNRIDYQKDSENAILIKVNGLKFGSSEARNYMKKEGTKRLKACAFIISNPVEKIILNFLLIITQPEIPAKMFTSEKEAFDWIQQYK